MTLASLERGTSEQDRLLDAFFKVLDYWPNATQRPIFTCNARFVIISGGERSGKSLTTARAGQIRILGRPQTGKKALYWLVAADYKRTQAEFDYLAEGFAKLKVLQDVTKRVDPGRIVLIDGTVIETKTEADPKTLASVAPDGIIVCEASQVSLETWWRLQGRVAEKRAWIIAAGTMEGSLGWWPTLVSSWRYSINPDERCFILPTSSNTAIYPGGEEDPELVRIRGQVSEQYYAERHLGIPMPPSGLVFHEFKPHFHVDHNLLWVPGEPVYLWIDPGYAGAYAVEAAQVIEGQVRVFGEVYERDMTTEDVISVVRGKPWSRDVKAGAIDVAATQHQAMGSVHELWRKPPGSPEAIIWINGKQQPVGDTRGGFGLYLNYQKVGVADGTERMKGFLKPQPTTGKPQIVFSPACRGILSEFGAMPNPFDGQQRVYQWRTDREGNIVGQEPEDRYNHGIKAVIYGLVDMFGLGYVSSERHVMKVVNRLLDKKKFSL